MELSVVPIRVDEAGCVPLLIEAAKLRTIRLPVGEPCKGRPAVIARVGARARASARPSEARDRSSHAR